MLGFDGFLPGKNLQKEMQGNWKPNESSFSS